MEKTFLLLLFTQDILKCNVNGCFKINGKQILRCLKKVNMLDSMRGK